MQLNSDLKQLIFNYLPLSLTRVISKKLSNKCWHLRYKHRYQTNLDSHKFLTRLEPMFLYHIAAAYNQDEICEHSLPFLSTKRAAYIAAKSKNWKLFTRVCKVGTVLDYNIIPSLINDDKVQLIKQYEIPNLDRFDQPVQFKSDDMIKIFDYLKYGQINYYINSYDKQNKNLCNNYGLLARAKRYLAGEDVDLNHFFSSLTKNIDDIDLDMIQNNPMAIIYFLANNIINNNLNSFTHLPSSSMINNYKMFKLAIEVFGQERAQKVLAIIDNILPYDITYALDLALDNYDIDKINQIAYYDSIALLQILVSANRVDYLSQLALPNGTYLCNNIVITNKEIARVILANNNLKKYYQYFNFSYAIDIDLLSTHAKMLNKHIDCPTLVNMLCH